MTKKIVFVVSMLMLVVAGLLFAAGGQENGPVTLRYASAWLDSPSFDPAFEQIIDDWAAGHAGEVVLKKEAVQGDNLRTKIKADLAAGTVPDIFNYWTETSIKPMVDQGVLLNIREYLDLSDKISYSDFPEDAWKAYSFDNLESIHGFPLEGSTAFFLANRELFDKYGLDYPQTYDDLLAVGEVFNANGITPLSVGSKGGNPAHFWYAAVWYQYVSDAYTRGIPTGETQFDCPEGVKTAQLILDMAKAGIFPQDTLANGDFGPAVALYNEGQAAMIMSFPWMINSFSEDIVAKSDLIDIPRMPGAVRDPGHVLVGGTNHGLVVNAASFHDPAKQPLIVDFLDMFLSDQVQTEVAVSGRWVEKNMTLDPSRLPTLYVRAKEYAEGKELNIHLWNRMPGPVSQEVFSFAMDELWAQTITAEEFTAKVQESIDSELSN